MDGEWAFFGKILYVVDEEDELPNIDLGELYRTPIKITLPDWKLPININEYKL